MKMSLNSVSGSQVSEVYSSYSSTASKTDTKKETDKAADTGVVYEKSSDKTESKATYSINKMSAEERAALVKQLKADQDARKQSLVDIVTNMMNKQAKTYSIATEDDSIWKFLASGEFEVDADVKAQAQEDISEDGYWGVKQTAQRLFDYASALAGDDKEKMKEMQEAMEEGFKQATSAWGKDLPSISQDTLDAANKLFEDYYKAGEEE